MSARRELAPFFVTLALAAALMFSLARRLRPGPRALAPAPTVTAPAAPPSPPSRPSRPSFALPAKVPSAPSRPPAPPPTSAPVPVAETPRLRAVAPPEPPRVASTDGGAGGLAAARVELDALRERLRAIDVDAGGASARVARMLLVNSAATAIHQALSAEGDGFLDRYQAAREGEGEGAADAPDAASLRPEDLPRAEVLDALGALIRDTR